MVGSPPTFAAQQTLDLAPPQITFARLSVPAGDLILDFDQTLRPGTISPANFSLRLYSQFWNLNTAHVSDRQIIGIATVNGAAPAGDYIDYYATPKQIRNLALVPALPFANFPLLGV